MNMKNVKLVGEICEADWDILSKNDLIKSLLAREQLFAKSVAEIRKENRPIEPKYENKVNYNEDPSPWLNPSPVQNSDGYYLVTLLPSQTCFLVPFSRKKYDFITRFSLNDLKVKYRSSLYDIFKSTTDRKVQFVNCDKESALGLCLNKKGFVRTKLHSL